VCYTAGSTLVDEKETKFEKIYTKYVPVAAKR